ncbi:MAG: hypothetical protein KDA28_17370, partial [Phycisphaerales bacterium]|nr:hypothetical protein [Phycisphaerales bacterium]
MTRRTSGIVTNVLLGAVGVVATGVIITNAVRGECAMCAMFAGSSDTEEASPETGPVDPSVVATSPSVDPDDQGNDASTDPDL